MNDTSNHIGGTIFAPSNFAFQRLGPKINGFLFSSYGRRYLKALLEYHVVANQTLYSDAYYKAEGIDKTAIPNGYFHVSAQTHVLCRPAKFLVRLTSPPYLKIVRLALMWDATVA